MDWGSVFNFVGGIFGRSSQRNAQRQAEEQRREYAEKAAARQNAIAMRTWRQQIKSIHQNYLNQNIEREWNHWNALAKFQLNEVQIAGNKRLLESRQEFQYSLTELNRRTKYDLEKIAYESSKLKDRDAYDQRQFGIDLQNIRRKNEVDQYNFNVDLQYLADEQVKKLNDIENAYVTEMEDLADKENHSIAMQRYNITIGEIAVDVFKTQLAGNKALKQNERQALERFGQRLALGQAGNSVIRLLTDITNDKSRTEVEILNEMDSAIGAGMVAEAKAKLRLAEDLKKRYRNPKRIVRGAVRGFQKTFIETPSLEPYRELPNMPQFINAPKLVHARHIPGVAPIRGPEIPEPEYPEKPILVTADEIMGGYGGYGGSALSDILGTAVDFGRLIWNNRPTPAANMGPSIGNFQWQPYTPPTNIQWNPITAPPPITSIYDSSSANSHPMGGGWR